MQNHKPHQAVCPALWHLTVWLLYSSTAASRNRQGWVQDLCNFPFLPQIFCHVFWICSCGCFLRNSAHSNVPVVGGLLLYCRLFSARTFSGTQVLALLSVEDSFQFPFPTREEAEVAFCLPGDGFRCLAVRGAAMHEQRFAGGWDYFFFL